jgi:SNF2 family DNA or RNA helicase
VRGSCKLLRLREMLPKLRCDTLTQFVFVRSCSFLLGLLLHNDDLQRGEALLDTREEGDRLRHKRPFRKPKRSGEGHRMLVFSQWTTMLDLLEELCVQLVLEYRRLDGSTAVAERQEMVDDFNQDENIKVFLLSTRAGGLGLNLTGPSRP